MRLDEQLLDESQLNNFILQNSEKCKKGLETVIVELKQKAKLLRKDMNSNEDEEAGKEAGALSGIVKFLKKIAFERLMAMALLDKKSLRKKFNSPDVLQKQRALYLFASHASVKPIIQEFREQYPNWKEANGLLNAKTAVKKNKQILTDIVNVMEPGESGSKVKKKLGKKSLKRKNIEMDNDANDNTNLKPQKKKKKTIPSVTNSSSPEGSPTKEGQQETQSPVLQNGVSNKPHTPAAKDRQGRFNRQNQWQKGRGGKFNRRGDRRGNFHQNKRNRNADFKGRNGSWKSKQPSSWKQRKFGDSDNPNNISVPSDWQKKAAEKKATEGQTDSLLRPSWLTNPEERKPTQSYGKQRNFGRREPASANMIRISSDWKNKVATPKSEEGQTSSLLRPAWLTNPQEAKPAASFNKSRGNFKRWRKR